MPQTSRTTSTSRAAGARSTRWLRTSRLTATACRRLFGEQDLLERVAAEAEPERLERDHLVRRDVAEVDRWAELADEPGLSRLRRRLEDDVRGTNLHRDLADQLGAHAAGRVEDAGGAALARLGDHLPGAGGELLVQPPHPLVGRVLDGRVLRAHLGEDGEVAREVGDQLELTLAWDVDRAVRDLDVRDPEAVSHACTRRAGP